MRCEICKRGPHEAATLFRVNKKGVKGVWRCENCLTRKQAKAIDPEVKDIMGVISGQEIKPS